MYDVMQWCQTLARGPYLARSVYLAREAIPNDYYILYGKKLVPYSMLKQNLFGSILKDSFVQRWPATLFKF